MRERGRVGEQLLAHERRALEDRRERLGGRRGGEERGVRVAERLGVRLELVEVRDLERGKLRHDVVAKGVEARAHRDDAGDGGRDLQVDERERLR